MLQDYYSSSTRLRQLRCGPLADHLDGFAASLRRQGLSRNHMQGILTISGKFSRFLRGRIDSAAEIDESLLSSFFEELASEGSFDNARTALRHLLEYLREHHILVLQSAPGEDWGPLRRRVKKGQVSSDEETALLDRYLGHLRDVRGLADSTCDAHRRTAVQFINWARDRHSESALFVLSGADILDFTTQSLRGHASRSGRAHLCSNLRSFLRYLQWEGIVTHPLDRTVPRVAGWRLDTLPRHLPWEQIQALLDSVDTCSAEGRRDKGILMLIAILGLRAGEVCALELSHVAWQDGELRLVQTKARRERVLPLPQEVGAALADYVLHARPPLSLPQLFVRHCPPSGPLLANSITHIVQRRLRDAGIQVCHAGAHLLRHSLATRMVNTGVPIKTIADVLGHADIDTTAIYTKVDRHRLASAALPFPGGAE